MCIVAVTPGAEWWLMQQSMVPPWWLATVLVQRHVAATPSLGVGSSVALGAASNAMITVIMKCLGWSGCRSASMAWRSMISQAKLLWGMVAAPLCFVIIMFAVSPGANTIIIA